MKTFARGQRSRLDALTPSLELAAGLRIGAPGLAIDFCCFGLDADGRLSDDRFFVFYNQTLAPARAIEIAPPAGDEQRFLLRLENLPSTIRRLVFTASIDGAGTMSQIQSGHLRLAESGSGAEVMRYEFSGRDFGGEGALMLGEIYWKDGWRVWAVGQGFAGNLSALLRHFGGEEIEDSSQAAPAAHAPAASPASRTGSEPEILVGAAAVIPPPPASVSTLALSSSASAARGGEALQELIDAAPSGGVLEIGRGEFEGPIVLRRPLTLVGAGGVVWARSGPVVTVSSAGVILRGVEIQVTAPESSGASRQADVALEALPSTCPSLHGVRVRGRVVGAGEDGGEWNLPGSLELGELAPRAPNSFEFEVQAPVGCSLSCSIAGASVEPEALGPGRHRVRLWVREVPSESFVCGEVEVRAGQVIRSVAVWGRGGAAGTPVVRDRILAG